MFEVGYFRDEKADQSAGLVDVIARVESDQVFHHLLYREVCQPRNELDQNGATSKRLSGAANAHYEKDEEHRRSRRRTLL